MTTTIMTAAETISGIEDLKISLPRPNGRDTLYVLTPQWWHQIGLMHTLTAKHLLALRPEPGDEIVAAIDYAWYTCTGEDAAPGYSEGTVEVRLSCTFERRTDRTQYHPTTFVHEIASHPGRSAMLGEDGLEDAHGHPIAIDFLWEKAVNPRSDYNWASVSYSEREIDWSDDKSNQDHHAYWMPKVRFFWRDSATQHYPNATAMVEHEKLHYEFQDGVQWLVSGDGRKGHALWEFVPVKGPSQE